MSATSTPVRPILKGSNGATPSKATDTPNDPLALLNSPRTLNQRRVTFSPFTKQLQRKNAANLAKRAAPLASWVQTSSPPSGPQPSPVQSSLVFSLLESDSTPARRAKMRRKERMILKMMYHAARQPTPQAEHKQKRCMLWECVNAVLSKIAPSCGLLDANQRSVNASSVAVGRPRQRVRRRSLRRHQSIEPWTAQQNSLDHANRQYLNALMRPLDASPLWSSTPPVSNPIRLPKPSYYGSFEALTAPPKPKPVPTKLPQQVVPVQLSKEDEEYERLRRELPGVRFAL